MPKRTDIKKILLIGSGPIVIGQACEFDYSGTQALKALKEEGYEVILVNSNPATIMTDPELSDRVYVEPLTVEFLEKIIAKEKPDALIPTMGGQTALNLTMRLFHAGILDKYNVKILGANPDAIERAENRDSFKEVMKKIGCESARSFTVHSTDGGRAALREIGLPIILRPSFTLGGEGGGVAYTEEEFLAKLSRGLELSPTKEVLVEESLLGWKEFELEVVRDKKDNVVIVCSIENLDPMGVHTGDSITIAPAQTLTDREYQVLRDQSIRIIRAIGVETGGSNIQFAIHPETGRVIVIEMNPRVSRSSALASKATGFPIARVAAKLAVGYTLDELTNDITGTTPCSFEPSIDYIVTKIPRFDFEKFKNSDNTLSTQMKSVGEVMAIGRTFEESFGKALSGLETDPRWLKPLFKETRWDLIERPNPKRIFAIADAIRSGTSLEELHERCHIDLWFLRHLERMILVGEEVRKSPWPLSPSLLLQAKKFGWSDRAISEFHAQSGVKLEDVRALREKHEIRGAFQLVDTCAAEFEAKTPYYYSTYHSDVDGDGDARPSTKQKVMILGGGPNRIGQGIEFDYCCVHAAMSLRALGYETVMVNSNPETVSTDFDISDKLYFEPLTIEHVMNIARIEKPIGAIVQYGGQTPLNLAKRLEQAGLKILGTSTQSIDMAEDRKQCEALVRELQPMGLEQPPSITVFTREEALERVQALGYPVLVRPSFVLGGRGMKIVRNEAQLKEFIDNAIQMSGKHPVLIDRFLNRATEVDVDAMSDGDETFICGLMEHIEEAGIHSGDSACSLPAMTLSKDVNEQLRKFTREIAKKLKVVGLMNIQFAVADKQVYLLEINPRASRTVPFVSKSVGKPVAKLAVQVMLGQKLKDIGIREDLDLHLNTYNVKAPVFPFDRFPGVDVLLGPEMKSTGEVMGRGKTFATAYAKALIAAGMKLPKEGKVFLSIRDEDKNEILPIAKELVALGFQLVGTAGTAKFLNDSQVKTDLINKVAQGSPHCVEAIVAGQFQLIINTVSEDDQSIKDSYPIRRTALEKKVPYLTVLTAARTITQAIRALQNEALEILPL